MSKVRDVFNRDSPFVLVRVLFVVYFLQATKCLTEIKGSLLDLGEVQMAQTRKSGLEAWQW